MSLKLCNQQLSCVSVSMTHVQKEKHDGLTQPKNQKKQHWTKGKRRDAVESNMPSTSTVTKV